MTLARGRYPRNRNCALDAFAARGQVRALCGERAVDGGGLDARPFQKAAARPAGVRARSSSLAPILDSSLRGVPEGGTGRTSSAIAEARASERTDGRITSRLTSRWQFHGRRRSLHDDSEPQQHRHVVDNDADDQATGDDQSAHDVACDHKPPYELAAADRGAGRAFGRRGTGLAATDGLEGGGRARRG